MLPNMRLSMLRQDLGSLVRIIHLEGVEEPIPKQAN